MISFPPLEEIKLNPPASGQSPENAPAIQATIIFKTFHIANLMFLSCIFKNSPMSKEKYFFFKTHI